MRRARGGMLPRRSIPASAAMQLLLACAAVSLSLTAASPAHAADRFDGRCAVTGTIRFDQPVGTEPRTTSFRERARGSCTGKLNGKRVVGSPVRIRTRGRAELSCLFVNASNIRSRIRFTRRTPTRRDDAVISFIGDATGSLGQTVSRIRGAVSGRAVAYVSFLAYSDARTMERCQSGSLTRQRFDATSQTITPLVG